MLFSICFCIPTGVMPFSVLKAIYLLRRRSASSIARQELMAAQVQAKYESMSEKQVSKETKRLEKLMLDHAKNLEFEKAAQVRD